MKIVRQLLALGAMSSSFWCVAQTDLTPYERSHAKASAAYRDGIGFLRGLADDYDTIAITESGPTDSGEPLHVVTYASNGRFLPEPLAKRKRSVVLILNAIHPGEPDGVDASMMLLRDLAGNGGPGNVLVAVVPYYNIGGALNRNATTRANQNGPAEYGFRGNARNYDLNRDFMKADSRNAMSFARLLHTLDPDVFVDTHVSNGADYQHVLTLLATQKDKLAAPLGEYLDKEMVPAITSAMSGRGQHIVPYVNVFGRTPDSGWSAFLDSPRYSTGYVAQFQTAAFMTETHMLKPFAERVAATHALLSEMVVFAARERTTLQKSRLAARRSTIDASRLAISYEPSRDSWTDVDFRGYEGGEAKSEVSGLPRLVYDSLKPWQGKVRFYNDFRATAVIDKPVAYLIAAGQWPVVERLANAGVSFSRVENETKMRVQRYRIDAFKTAASPYEGHYPHSQTSVVIEEVDVTARVGDVLIPTGTMMDQFLINALEPAAADSYFNWNLFDAILQRKEYFSAYVFEDKAADILAIDPALAVELDKRRAADEDFAGDARAQLNFVYERSEHAEQAYRMYPVYRVIGEEQLAR